MNFRKVRAAAVLATMTSSLLAPAAAWAASAPAQPGTVRPEEKVVAQPGTSRAAESNEADDNKPAGKQPEVSAVDKTPKTDSTMEKTPTEPVVAAEAAKPAAAATIVDSSPAPVASQSQVAISPATAQAQVEESHASAIAVSLADKATETTADTSVRDSAAEDTVAEEAPSVRTEQADEAAAYELASVIAEDGDVREKARSEHDKVAVRGDDLDVAAADQADGGADDPQPDPGTDSDHAPVTNVSAVTSVSAGAALAAEPGTVSVGFETSAAGLEVTVGSQPTGAATTNETTIGVAGNTVTFRDNTQTASVVVPELPSEITTAVDQAVKAVDPSDVIGAVNASGQDAVQQALSAAPDGSQTVVTPIGQLSGWFEAK